MSNGTPFTTGKDTEDVFGRIHTDHASRAHLPDPKTSTVCVIYLVMHIGLYSLLLSGPVGSSNVTYLCEQPGPKTRAQVQDPKTHLSLCFAPGRLVFVHVYLSIDYGRPGAHTNEYPLRVRAVRWPANLHFWVRSTCLGSFRLPACWTDASILRL